MKKTKATYEKDKIMYAFVEAKPKYTGDTAEKLRQEYEDYKESLFEIDCMIQHFQDMGNNEEVGFWRRLLMHNKMVMREIKKKIREYEMVATIISKEVAHS